MEENYMKKILSLGVAATVVSLTAVAASAAIAPAFDTDAPVAGGGNLNCSAAVANGMTQEATTFTVNASEGLTLTANEAVTGGIFSTETNKFAWAGTAVPADGTVLLTLTYTVDAAADSEVSVSLTPDAGFTDISADAVAAVVVAGASTDVPNVTVETTETVETVESTEQPTVIETAETDETTETVDTKPADDGKGNPGTGVALAVVPAVLAGAAIVVAKKRK